MSAPPPPALLARVAPWRRSALATLVVTAALAWSASPATAASRAKSAQALAYFDRGAKLYKGGKYAESAPFFLRAWSTHAVPDYLFNAARAEHRSGQLAAARQHYQLCLTLEHVNPQIRLRAKTHIDEISARLAAEEEERLAKAAVARAAAPPKLPDKPVPEPVSPPTVQQAESDSGAWLKPVGWVALGGGLLAGGLGAWLLVSHGQEQADLDAQLAQTDTAGLITGIDHLSYSDEQSSLHQRRQLAIGSLAAAGTLAVLGGWMLWSAPDAAAALVVGEGLSVALRTRF